MRAGLVFVMVFGLVSPAFATDDGNDWIAKARAIILRHHLLSRSDLRCTGLIYGTESTPTMAGITAVEIHKKPCKGDPDTSPRMFTMDIDKATGRASWDRDSHDFVMKPIP